MNGVDEDDGRLNRILKRKVKNTRSNLYEWIKYRCHCNNGYLECIPVDEKEDEKTLEIMLGNILQIQTKAASRFEIIYATSNGHEKEEFMASTSQHSYRWVRQLKEIVRIAMEIPSSHHTLSSTIEKEKYRRSLPSVDEKQPTKSHDDSLKKSNKEFDPSLEIATDSPDSTKSIHPVTNSATWKHGLVSTDESPIDATSEESIQGYTPSEQEASEQLGILVRVEGALRQLEMENKECSQREIQLRNELANLNDRMRLLEIEKQELLIQLQDITEERDEWKSIARRKQEDISQLGDDLQLAKDEVRLLTNEKNRLNHRNKELAIHVQRLDTLVYGKF